MLAPEFERHVRDVFASLATPCPLDGTAENLLQLFTCGRHELVVRDIRAVLPADAAERALDLIARRGVADAFQVRRDLVNYKKAMLHAHDDAHRLQKDLRQLVAFHRRVDYQEGDAFFTHAQPHASLCDALASCTQ